MLPPELVYLGCISVWSGGLVTVGLSPLPPPVVFMTWAMPSGRRPAGVSARACGLNKAEVRSEARESGRRVHFGKLKELCVEKNSDILGQGKYKVRVVYWGDCEG